MRAVRGALASISAHIVAYFNYAKLLHPWAEFCVGVNYRKHLPFEARRCVYTYVTARLDALAKKLAVTAAIAQVEHCTEVKARFFRSTVLKDVAPSERCAAAAESRVFIIKRKKWPNKRAAKMLRAAAES